MGRIRVKGGGRTAEDVARRAVEQTVFDAWRRLRRGAPHRAVRALYERDMQRLEPSQVDVLDVLFERGSCTMGDLAEALEIEASTATRSVARLVDRGFVRRDAEDADGRIVRIALTAEGEATVERFRIEREQFLRVVLGGLDDDELAAGAQFMEQLIEGTERAIEMSRAMPGRELRTREVRPRR